MIKEYFEGDSKNPPVRELLYAHTHPLIRPTFLSEIESMIGVASEAADRKGISPESKVVSDLILNAQKLGELIPSLDETSAPQCLLILRKIYTTCGKIIGK